MLPPSQDPGSHTTSVPHPDVSRSKRESRNLRSKGIRVFQTHNPHSTTSDHATLIASMFASGYRRPRGSRGSCIAASATNRLGCSPSGDRRRRCLSAVRFDNTIAVGDDGIGGRSPLRDHRWTTPVSHGPRFPPTPQVNASTTDYAMALGFSVSGASGFARAMGRSATNAQALMVHRWLPLPLQLQICRRVKSAEVLSFMSRHFLAFGFINWWSLV